MLCCQAGKRLLVTVRNVVEGHLRKNNIISTNKSHKLVAANRLKTCYSCEHKKKNLTCALCGCDLPAKVLVMEENCPINKW